MFSHLVRSPSSRQMLIESFPGQRRFGDPVVGQLNATGSEEHFRELWIQVEHLRSTRNWQAGGAQIG